jgi:hypothetical protein
MTFDWIVKKLKSCPRHRSWVALERASWYVIATAPSSATATRSGVVNQVRRPMGRLYAPRQR